MRGTLTVSVDVEDWHQLVTRRFTGALPDCSEHVVDQTARLLDLLEERGIAGTFFVLGMVARARPELVRAIAARGHEVASHGESHVPLFRLERAQVRAELRDSKARLSDLAGTEIAGYRAPEFSITAANRWALDEVADAGYRYDSSIYPIAHRRYGIRDFPRGPVRLASGLWELPLATLPTPAGNLPIAGGGYFRVAPGAALAAAIRSVTDAGDHAMMYFHPYEFADAPLRLASSPGARAGAWLALQALGRSRLPGRARRAIGVARAVRAVDLVDALDSP